MFFFTIVTDRFADWISAQIVLTINLRHCNY